MRFCHWRWASLVIFRDRRRLVWGIVLGWGRSTCRRRAGRVDDARRFALILQLFAEVRRSPEVQHRVRSEHVRRNGMRRDPGCHL